MVPSQTVVNQQMQLHLKPLAHSIEESSGSFGLEDSHVHHLGELDDLPLIHFYPHPSLDSFLSYLWIFAIAMEVELIINLFSNLEMVKLN